MYCRNCGAQNSDDSTFCSNCGSPLPASSQNFYSSPNPVSPPTGYYSPSQSGGGNAYNPYQYSGAMVGEERTQFRKNFRAVSGSPVYLIAVIIFSVSFLLSFIQLQDTSYSAYYILRQIGLGIDRQTIEIFCLLAMIPTILMGIGMWLQFADSRSPNMVPVRTTGISMMFGVTVYQLVMVCILFFVLFVASCSYSAYSEISRYGYGNSHKTGLPGIVMAVALLGTFFICYFSFQLRLLSSAKASAARDGSCIKSATAVAVFSFIITGISLFGCISAEAFSLQILLSFAQYIMFSIVALQIKNTTHAPVRSYYGM